MPRNVSTFAFDPMFDHNLLHWKDSLNGVGDVFRRTSDRYANKVRAVARKRIDSLGSDESTGSERYSRSGRYRAARRSALIYNLRKYAELVYAIEVHGEDRNWSAVCAGHAAGIRMEYGGVDAVTVLPGGQRLVYQPMNILREVA